MSDYYQTCLAEISKLIESADYDAAGEKIREELNMPYIPGPFEETLRELQRSIPVKSVSHGPVFMDGEALVRHLRGTPSQQESAMHFLNRANIRQFLDELMPLLKDGQFSDELKKQILLVCIDQDVQEALYVTFAGICETITPVTLVNPVDSDAAVQGVHLLSLLFESSDPSLLNLCTQAYLQALFKVFPHSPDPEAVFSLIDGVTYAVLESLGRVDEWVSCKIENDDE